MIDIETEYQVKRKLYEILKPLPLQDMNKIVKEMADRLRMEYQISRVVERKTIVDPSCQQLD